MDLKDLRNLHLHKNYLICIFIYDYSFLSIINIGRCLEKFLRRNSYSSDERETTITTSKTSKRNKTKSLESLKDIGKDEIPKKEDILSPPKNKSSVDKSEIPQQKSSMEQSSKIVVKQSGEKSDKKKSNKFNYESVIEITLPPSNISIPQQQQISNIELPSKCQDDERIEEPITPIISAPTKPKSKKEILQSPSSKPESKESVVSNKQQNMNPLEWDSFMGLMPVSS
jgi:hypothetical protein